MAISSTLRLSYCLALTIALAPTPAHADRPPPGCVRPEPDAYLLKRTYVGGEGLVLGREVRWIKGLGRDERNTLDLATGELWEGLAPVTASPVEAPQVAAEPEPPAKPLVRVKRNGWTLDWVATGKPIVKELLDAWSINASRTHLLLLTAEGEGRGFYVYDVKTRKRLRRESWPRSASFGQLPDGEHYLFGGAGRASLTDATGKRIADVGDDPGYDSVSDVDGVWVAVIRLDSHPGVPLLRLLHPRCDAVVVQSLSTGEIVRREDLRGLRSSSKATGEGCVALGDAAGRLVVLPGVHAADVVGRVDLSAEPALQTWRLPTCAPHP